MSFAISGMSQFSTLGQGLSALQEGLDQRKVPCAVERKVATREGEKIIRTYTTDEVTLPSFIPDGVARRMSRLSRMCFAAVAESLQDAFANTERNPERMGLVVGTAFGALDLANAFQARVQLEGLTGASPSLFASSVQNSIASHLSITFNLQGPSATVMTMEQTTAGSFRLAYDWLAQGLVDHVVVVIGDEISEYHAYLMAHQKSEESMQFKSDQCTALLGEGAVSFVLSRSDDTQTQKKYAKIEKVDLFVNETLKADRTFVASYGREGQWSQYKKNEFECHVHLYGSLITGMAFEIAIAAMKIATDKKSTACLQMTDHDEMQSIFLTSF